MQPKCYRIHLLLSKQQQHGGDTTGLRIGGSFPSCGTRTPIWICWSIRKLVLYAKTDGHSTGGRGSCGTEYSTWDTAYQVVSGRKQDTFQEFLFSNAFIGQHRRGLVFTQNAGDSLIVERNFFFSNTNASQQLRIAKIPFFGLHGMHKVKSLAG